jgi:trimeric autotransporter adhesin
MSTKTTFKRIALVAVASLGFGMLSAAPSSAANIITVPTLAITSPATANAGTTDVPITQGTAIVGNLQAITTAGFTDIGDGVDIAYVVTNPQGTVITSSVTFAAPTTLPAGLTVTASATGLAIRTTTAANVILNTTAKVVGTITIPASATLVAGTYTIASTVTAVNATGGTADTDTTGQQMDGTTSVARGQIFVSGTSVTQGLTRGLTGTATVGNVATVTWFTPTHANSSAYRITSSGVGSVTRIAQGAGTATSILPISGVTGNWNSGAVYTTAAATTTESATIQLSSTVAGVQTVTVQIADATTGNLTTVATSSVTWGTAPTMSASLSTVFAAGGSARATALETTALRLPSTAGVTMTTAATTGVSIAITANNGDGEPLVGQAVTATISGPGLLSITAGNSAAVAGTARSVSLTAAAQSGEHRSTIGVSGDGTRGVGTITITVGGVVYTKTVTFYGAVATLTATQGVSIMRAGRTATSAVADFTLGGVDPARLATAAIGMDTATNISIVAKDVDGNVVPLATAPTADISNAAAIAAVNIASCAGGGATTVCASGEGNWIANTIAAVGGVSGAASTVTFKTPHPTLPATFISTDPVPFTLGGSALGGTVTMTLDKAVYEPGERMIITYTAKDAAGNPVRDWAAVGAPASNKAIVGLNGTGVYVKGSHIYGDGATELTYAPTAPGPFTVTLSTGTATGATITATATVADDAATTAAAAAGDAAAEATDAANAATDAANAAAEAADAATAAAQDAADAVAALSTSVTAMVDSLRKQITSLTNLVIKIQRKVRA